MPTPHINAQADDFSETVIMPGDPLRAEYIANKYLEDPRQVTNVRNVYGYTGCFSGVELSVMAHGMGIPSATIYTTELIKDYGVKNIIRVGSCGAISDDVALRDIVVAMGASTDSNTNRLRFKGHDFCALANYQLLQRTVNTAENAGTKIRVGNLFTSDFFYLPDPGIVDVLKKYGVLGIDMEAAGIYGVAAEYGVRALAVCTVSDHISKGLALSAEERQESFDEMIELVLQSTTLDVAGT